MKIIFHPILTKFNKYIEIMVDILAKEGVECYPLYEIFNRRRFSKIDIVHLNWYENLYETSKSGRYKSFLKKVFRILLIRICRKKVVWTMHNKTTHDQTDMFLKNILLKSIIRVSDAIVVHSLVSKQIIQQQFPNMKLPKIYYIPHPNYIDKYGSIIPNTSEKRGSSLNLLFMGAVKPYKNIELLIEVVKQFKTEHITLKVAGRVINHEYQVSLEKMCAGFTNITLDFVFIADESIPSYLSECDLVVLPYDRESSLNSGSVLLAFSYKRTVICPDIGTITDIENIDSVFSYSYITKEEHANKLHEAISRAYNNKDELTKMGTTMYNEVMSRNSEKLIGKRLIELYQELKP